MPKSDTIRDNTLCTIRSQGSFFLLLLFDGLFCILYCSLSTIKKDNNCSALWILCYYYILNVSRLCLIFPWSPYPHVYWSITSSHWRNCLIQKPHESGTDSFCMSYDPTNDINQKGWWLHFEVTQHVVDCFDSNSSHWSYQRSTVTIWHPRANLCSVIVMSLLSIWLIKPPSVWLRDNANTAVYITVITHAMLWSWKELNVLGDNVLGTERH